MQRNKFTLIGFILFMLGSLSLILQLVYVKIIFLAWIDNLGILPSFLIKIFMILIGLGLVVYANTDTTQYDEYFDGHKND